MTKKLGSTPSSEFPISLTFFPRIGIAAMRGNFGGAWRLWLITKNLDNEGRGAIPSSALLTYADYLRLNSRTLHRWHNVAGDLGLIHNVTRKSGERWVVITSHEKAAFALGCMHVDRRQAIIPAKALVSTGWRAIVWAGFIATLPGRPISRNKLREITGVPKSTQRNYEKNAGVRRIPNYILSDMTDDFLPGIREFERPHAFKYWDNEQKNWVVAWRGPDHRDASNVAECGVRGRSRKVNKKIKILQGLSPVGRAPFADNNYLRLFNKKDSETKSSLRKLANDDIPPWEVQEIYEHKHDGSNAQFWKVIER